MGRSLEEANAHSGFEALFPPALLALASSTSVADSLDSRNSKSFLNRALSFSDQLTPGDGLSDGLGVPILPGDVTFEPVTSPLSNDAVEPNMNLLVGGALAPLPMGPPRPPPPPRAGPGFRLPSFQRLGIAAPHPYRVGSVAKNDNLRNQAAEESRSRLSVIHGDENDLSIAVEGMTFGLKSEEGFTNPNVGIERGRAVQSPIHHYVNTITPPAEQGPPLWNLPATVEIPGMHSPSSEPAGTTSAEVEVQSPSGSGTVGTAPRDDKEDAIDDTDASSWINGAVNVLLENLRTASRPTDALKILSHALPITSASGHIFADVINAIHVSTPVSPITPLTWVNVFHAIPGRFNLADLPTSPPTTPGPPIGGDDYFTQKIFDSAVSISDYQDDLTSLPRSPRPVVPPSSIDVTIVERYIPPSSSNEFAEMFDPNGSSILVDRLVELSPDNGSLLFIYPTKAGAETFMREYLGPILDPLLRTMVVVHRVSTDLCISLGNMASVRHLFDYESLQHRIFALCARLSQQNAVPQRLHGRRPPIFTLSYASKQSVKLPRGVWAREWWTKQEKTRLKDTINAHYRESQTRRTSASEFGQQSASPTVLLQELLDGVSGKPTQEKERNSHAIEVGVFVITRSK